MKRQRISVLLCLSMILMLLPTGLFSIDVSALERPAEQYVSAGTEWKTTTDYQSVANTGNDNTLYYKDGDNYYPVSWQTGEDLYTISGTANKNWSPSAVASGSYYYNIDNDKLNFSAVTTKSGYLYYLTTADFPSDFISENLTNLHESYAYFATSYFVKESDVTADGGYSRLMIVDYGASLRYYGWAYYWRDGRFNISQPGSKNRIDTSSRGLFTYSKPSDNASQYYNSNYVSSVNINNNDGATFSWISGDMTLNADVYLRTTGKNSLWYNNGSTQLGSTVYDTTAASTNSNQTAYTGALYTRNGTGTTTLTANGSTFGSATAINGDTIYSEDLYVKKYETLPSPSPTTIITTEETGDDGVYTHKELTPNGDAYDVTLTAYTTGNKVVTDTQTITPTVDPMDIVMVIDQSGSMATRDMGNNYTEAQTPSGGWTVDNATGGKQYYYSPDGGTNYYPVYASTGYVYEKVDGSIIASDLLSDGDDAISLGVNGAPTFYNIKTDYYVMDNGELHRLYLITAGLFLEYGLYPYIYKDNNDAFTNKSRWEGHNYWVAVFDPWDGSDLRDNGNWNVLAGGNGNGTSARFSFVNTSGQAIGGSDANADTARLSYSFFKSSAAISNLYKLSDSKVANQLYYVDAAGNQVNIGTAAQYAGDVVYSGTLYEGAGTSRVDALKAAVTEFAEKVQQNAEDNNVDHRMAFAGFAGNKVPTYSNGADATTVGSNTLYDYTNTGLYEASGFENYEKITGYEATTDRYINRHYYQLVSGNYVPVKYVNGTWYRINLTTGAMTETRYNSSNWYKAVYEGNGTSLSNSDYRSALVSVNQSGSVNSQLTDAIDDFAANGGTYTSYGMTMAEQLFDAVENAGDTRATNSKGKEVDRQRVIIVFTDGEPGANGYNDSIAGEALVSGNLAKTEQDAIVYTVGLFKSSPSSQVADFMKKLSSEYTMNLSTVYGGQDNTNYSLGNLDPDQTYYYRNETTGKYYAVTTEYGTGNSLGWWIYNGSASNNTTSWSLATPKRSTGAGSTVFYNASGSSVNGEDVNTGTTYYTSGGDKIVYEYRWFDSDRSIKNPKRSSSDTGSAGEERVQFYALSSAIPNTDGDSYYMTASNAEELNSIFTKIAGTLISEEVTVTNDSAYTEDTLYVMDEISADFDLPSDFSPTDNNHVTVYMEKPGSWDVDRTEVDETTGETVTVYKPNWNNSELTKLRQGSATQIEGGTADVEVVWNGKKLQINYFDFGRKYMQKDNPDAARIRVVIDGITPNKAGDPSAMSDLNPDSDSESGNDYWALKSNTAQSGLYYKDPESGSVTQVEQFKMPSAPVPGYTVTWVDDTGSNMDDPYDQDSALITGDKPIYDGEEPTKEADRNYTYQFDGWSTTQGGPLVISDIERDDETDEVTSYGTFPAVDSSDVTYYAHFARTEIVRYTVTWNMNDGTRLETDEEVDAGSLPEYNGSLPSISASDDYTYFFVGWTDNAQDASTIYETSAAAMAVVVPMDPVTADIDYYAVFGRKIIQTVNKVYDFSANTVLIDSGVYSVETLISNGGSFGLLPIDATEDTAPTSKLDDPGKLLFVAESRRTDKSYDFSVFSGVNSAIYYTDAAGENPTKITVVASSALYYDDDLLGTTIASTDGKGYSATVSGTGTSTNSKDISSTDAAVMYEFTFTGTGIDIYCTTDSETGYVQAQLWKDGARQEVKTVKSKSIDNGNYYNIPTVSFTDKEYGTYTLKLNVLKNSKYKLDGVRVYGAVAAENYAADEAEATAQYFNLRESLLNPENTTYTAISKETFGDEIPENASALSGVLFLDNAAGISYTTVNDAGETKVVYESDFAAYKANSPKNEIYLTNGQGVAFKLENWSDIQTAKVYLGLSAPKDGSGNVTVNDAETAVSVTSYVDMYYEITPDANGVVKIVNSGNGLISITNLKITGTTLDAITAQDVEAAQQTGTQSLKAVKRMAFAMMTSETVEEIAEPVAVESSEEPGESENPTVTPTPDEPEVTDAPEVTPTPTPSTPSSKNTIQKIISSIVKNMFKRISKLFGR